MCDRGEILHTWLDSSEPCGCIYICIQKLSAVCGQKSAVKRLPILLYGAWGRSGTALVVDTSEGVGECRSCCKYTCQHIKIVKVSSLCGTRRLYYFGSCSDKEKQISWKKGETWFSYFVSSTLYTYILSQCLTYCVCSVSFVLTAFLSLSLCIFPLSPYFSPFLSPPRCLSL
jgi:hypothetical protein